MIKKLQALENTFTKLRKKYIELGLSKYHEGEVVGICFGRRNIYK